MKSLTFACVALCAGASWVPVWRDDFSAPTLNPALWTVRNNMTHGSREWQLYLADEVYVEGGALVIRTRSRNASAGAREYNFTSGWVDTKGSALGENTFGMFSARIQLPREAEGVWPAYWMVDDNAHCWPTGGEIDILEAVGGVKGDSVSGTLHWGQTCGKDNWEGDGQRSGHFPHPPGAPFSSAFHNFTAFWNRTAVTWAVDGEPFVSRLAGQPADLFVPSWPLFTIFNTAIAFFGVPQPPPALAEPVFMRVDWAGAWRWDGPGGATGDFEIPYNATGLVPQTRANDGEEVAAVERAGYMCAAAAAGCGQAAPPPPPPPPQPQPPPAPWDAVLHLHSNATRDALNARCLDGTNGGFWFRPAKTPAAATKWKIHFQGGAWCTSPVACADRAKWYLGSSKFFPPLLSTFWHPEYAGFSGLMGLNDTTVSVTGDWNFVWLAYCDGASQTSDVTAPVVVGNVTIYLRGRALLDAHLAELEAEHGFLSTATEVVVSGTSAGGLSTHLHAPTIKAALRVPSARVVAVPDAGFWWDSPSYANAAVRPWIDMIAPALPFWNASLPSADGRACLAANAAAPVRCFTQPYLSAFTSTPTFHVQSLYDTYNLDFCFRFPCALGTTCNASEVDAAHDFRDRMEAAIVGAEATHGDRDGHVLTACYQHEESCRAGDWFGITIDGQTLEQTFAAWYARGGADPGAKRADGRWPSDASCPNITHGAC